MRGSLPSLDLFPLSSTPNALPHRRQSGGFSDEIFWLKQLRILAAR